MNKKVKRKDGIKFAVGMVFAMLVMAIIPLFSMSACGRDDVFMRLAGYEFRVENGYLVWNSRAVRGADLYYRVYVLRNDQDLLKYTLQNAGRQGIRYDCCCYIDGWRGVEEGVSWGAAWQARSRTQGRVSLSALGLLHGEASVIRVVSEVHQNVVSVGFWKVMPEASYVVVDYEFVVEGVGLDWGDGGYGMYDIFVRRIDSGGFYRLATVGWQSIGLSHFRLLTGEFDAVRVDRVSFEYAYLINRGEYDVLMLNRRAGLFEFRVVFEESEFGFEFGVREGDLGGWELYFNAVEDGHDVYSYSIRVVHHDTRHSLWMGTIWRDDGVILLEGHNFRWGYNTIRVYGRRSMLFEDGAFVVFVFRDDVVGEWDFEFGVDVSEGSVEVGIGHHHGNAMVEVGMEYAVSRVYLDVHDGRGFVGFSTIGVDGGDRVFARRHLSYGLNTIRAVSVAGYSFEDGRLQRYYVIGYADVYVHRNGEIEIIG